ncbi:hypothetical protein [Rhizobium sp. LC145]|uniref:hypothetical protein n=1 Tax=Rhizobium sp. LC145 TaxID=1120688 RepID=UPI000629DE6A|nr:hypothetical protein [Rhizobium sp. LC145]KKX28260.1 hypothetical protein YH62_19440 [Rhizobium sp. LC145]TKT58319.1 hypothetical protein FDR95_11965 [Rhizobiaceae bacterium LC148]
MTEKNAPPQTSLRVPVTREDAIKFLEGACRNWSKVPRLSNDDLQDVATELSRFVASRALATTEDSNNG